MFLKIKRGVSALLIACTVFAGPCRLYATEMVNMDLFYDGKNHTYSAQEIKIQVNGSMITEYAMPPVVLSDRTLVPARVVFEAIGAEVNWNPDTKEVYVLRGADLIVLKIDNASAQKNGTAFTLEAPPKIINDSTMIPVRAVAEALGCNVGWDAEARLVTISENTQPAVPETPEGGGNSQIEEVPSGGGNGGQTTTPEAPDNQPAVVPNGTSIAVTGVSLPANGANSFTITANGAITDYQALDISDNRLAVDIYHADMSIPNDNITATNSSIVSSIRSAQNQVDPVKITRVVFDLTGQYPYTVTQSADLKSLVVSFTASRNTLTNLQFTGDGRTDSVTLTGELGAPAVQVSSLGASALMLDIPNADSRLMEQYLPTNSRMVTNIQTLILADGTVRVLLEINGTPEYTVTKSGNNTTVKLSMSSVQNISYDTATKTLTLRKQGNLAAGSIQETDNYLQKKYVFTLPGDYEAVYGYGTMKIGDGSLESVTLENKNGSTALTVNETQIFAYLITEDSNNVYIQAVNPKKKYDKVVLIDPGHGGIKPGAIYGGVQEKELTLAIALKVISRLEADPNIKGYATRITDAHVENKDRALMGNQVADLFVSIHQNSVEGSQKPNGTEVWFMTHTNDLPGKLTSKIAAQTLVEKIVATVGTTNRGAKEDPELIVLNQSTIPAVLIECGFMTNPDDMARLQSEEYQNLYADAIYSAIVDMMNRYPVR